MWRTIGNTGLRVRAVGLGAMPLSIAGRPDAAVARAVIERFLELGGDFIDTANVYCLEDGDLGHNERLIAGVLAGRPLGRAGVVVATKGGLRRPRGEWVVDGDPAWLRDSCDRSLRDLGVDCIDLYQLHAVDPTVGIKASVAVLAELQQAGKIRHIGISNVSREQLAEACDVTPVVAVQNRCNVFDQQDLHNGMIADCAARGISYIAYSPVGGRHGHVGIAAAPWLQAIAGRHACSPYAVALAWLLGQGNHVIVIPGASRRASIEDSFTAMRVALLPEDLAALDRLPFGVVRR